ncbi:bifunctional DNA-binding transcriptional regulator/O6-methylguanine-DNA methyltransferase Ada [Roseomonas elaeocarpi]|uniref:Bifunctional DNA-binding transcriptional regulator/O6-methylguanine-DNA methyltransferase Ada n=1 Tax=Roseomonas elaeocarpi TaxID=907779 RepID=A0ABV6JU60_9PROT
MTLYDSDTAASPSPAAHPVAAPSAAFPPAAPSRPTVPPIAIPATHPQAVSSPRATRTGGPAGAGATTTRAALRTQDTAGTVPPPATADDPRWSRILGRDRAADGLFWYSVRTTGVYCRPSCPSRAARPENVAIHDSLDAARRTGCRPCRRCHPDDAGAADVATGDDPANGAQGEGGGTGPGRARAAVTRACRLIEAAETPPDLATLAAAAGLSPSHFHRLFRAATGLTPRAYAAAARAERLRQALAAGEGVTGALYGAGFSSAGRFYAQADAALGMVPSRFRDGGAGEEIRFAIGACSMGAILVAQGGRGVCAILLGDDPEALLHDLEHRFPRARLLGGEAGFERLVAEAVALVDRPGNGHALPLDLRGTAFQRRVWQALAEIPAGTTLSYAELARRIGTPQAVRAVAGACAANALAVAIPCHRVVRTDGALSGYRWGLERKRQLLDRERTPA